MHMQKFFRISPQQSIHQASSTSENYDIKLGDWGRGRWRGRGRGRGEGLFGLILLVSQQYLPDPPSAFVVF